MTRRHTMKQLAIDIACVLRDGYVLPAAEIRDIVEQLGYSVGTADALRNSISTGVFTTTTGEKIHTDYRTGKIPELYYSEQALCEYPDRVKENLTSTRADIQREESMRIAQVYRFLRK